MPGRAFRLIPLLFLLIGIYSLSAQIQDSGNVIRVDVSGFRNDKGQAFCALFAPADGFPTDSKRALARVRAPIVNGNAVCEFKGVAPGQYAVSVFHDENSNQKMDTNFLGIPKEGVGASNDAKGHMGPPKFDAAAFQYTGGRIALKIKMFYI